MKKQSFLKGVVLLAAAGIIVKLIGFVYRVVLTNLPGYGDEGNGLYGAGFQVYLFLYAISTTGFPSAISKLVAEKTALGDLRGAHRIFKVSFRFLTILGMCISILFFACSGYIAQLISNTRTTYTMAALSPTIFFVAIMAVFRGYFQGMQDMTPQAGSQIVEQAFKTFFTIVLAFFLLPYGIETAAAGATLGTTIGAAAGAFYLWNLYGRRKERLWEDIRNHSFRRKQESTLRIIKNLVKIAVPISLGAVILTVSNIIDLATVMSQLAKAGFDSKSANEMYGILTGKCYVLTHFPIAVTAALATSLVPAIAGAIAVRDHRQAGAKISASLRLTVLICLPSSAGLAILAEPILKMLFPGTSEGAGLLAISAFTVIFAGLTQTLSGILQGLGMAYIPLFGLLTGAAVKLAVNFLTIPMPHINIKGAVYGTLACYIISTVINLIALKVKFRLNLDIHDFIIKPMAATGIMGVTAYYTYYYLIAAAGNNFTATGVAITAAVIIYALTILLLGCVNSNDLNSVPFGRKLNRLLNKDKTGR